MTDAVPYHLSDAVYGVLWRSGLIPGRSADQVARLSRDVAVAVQKWMRTDGARGELETALDDVKRKENG